MQQTINLRVREAVPLETPRTVKAGLPLPEAGAATVIESRAAITRILMREDPRLLVVIGPCSIHDPVAAIDYARRLADLSRELSDRMLLVMRVYFEKPRTTIGWKGLINDPRLDGSCDIQAGLELARKILLDVNALGLPAGTEFLDPISPQYFDDLISWAAVGARTTESQTHREMASGLSVPVGFKNGTDGGLQIAIDAMQAARSPHSFLGIDEDGVTSIIRTTGNACGHVVLRGGRGRTNYDPASIADASLQLRKQGLPEALMVDCSHANSGKEHAKQEEVWQSVIAQRVAGNTALTGVMVESNLHEGNQPMPVTPADLKYGVSLTDACINWETTERMLRFGHAELGKISQGQS
jgi:3-deoxy-7-phosphoheptulonate synthase